MNKHFDIKEQLLISSGELYRTVDNIIIFNPSEGLNSHSIAQMEEMIAAVQKLSNGDKLPYITDINNAVKFSSEEKNKARESLRIFKSAAFVTNASISRVIMSAFLLFHKNSPPLKVFKSIEEAKKWSLQNIK